MHFTKMHGAGNDFIIVDADKEKIPASDMSALAKALCTPRTGLGADGMMFVLPPVGEGNLSMRFYNADGSLGEMCGNGARCICRYGLEKGFAAGDSIRVETTAGLVSGHRVTKREYQIRLNDPSVLEAHRSVFALGNTWDMGYAELGNPGIPHGILLWENLPTTTDLDAIRPLGAALRRAQEFPKGANITFCRVREKDTVDAVTFERGVEDFTLACGTGAGALTAILTLRGLVSGRNVRIFMPGGMLTVSLSCTGDTVSEINLTGPTAMVAEGEICREEIKLC